ncbi:porin [Bordetella genomosp. 13]|uniref:Porin n=1 Tax=Bordetella genomosp. 13 TaxID=463040 RepID=A0A1W6ZFQ7_9BORD|nr:porin [Bordetella genomosp. 13]ARP95970.1 porin [Bordetella genomosp. 13]
MKKTLLAAALLAGFAGAAQAETSVTLYGIIDTGIGYNQLDLPSGDGFAGYDHSRIGMINGVQNGSRWGLRGSEDLGDGLRAVFQLESGFDSSTGNSAQGGRLFGRQATVGLASNSWGQLDFGRQTNIASKYFGSIDPFGAGFAQANIGHAFSAANTNRYDNMVMYQTPSFSGFQLGVGYSFNVSGSGNFATADNVRGITAGARYVNGPLQVALAFDQLNPADDDDATPRQYTIGAAYDFEVVKLALAYARTEDGWFAGQGPGAPTGGVPSYTLPNGSTVTASYPTYSFADGFRANSYMVGLTAPLGGATSLFGSWQMIDPKNDNLTGGDETSNVFSLGATYDLSKRTNLYLYGSYAKNALFIDDAKSTAAGVGIRHRF